MSIASSSSSSFWNAANSKNIRTGFTAQTFQAQQKKDQRHEQLQANVKPSDLTDNDKIFLLKREIDQLRSQVYVASGSFRSVDNNQNQNPQHQNTKQAGFSGFSSSAAATTATATASNSKNSMSTTMLSYRIPFVTIMLAVGVLLLAARFLRRKISHLRLADSLLRMDEDTEDDTIMIELQSAVPSFSTSSSSSSSSSHHEGGGWQQTPSITLTDHHNTRNTNLDNPTPSSFTISDDQNDVSNLSVAPSKSTTTTTTTPAGAGAAEIQFV